MLLDEALNVAQIELHRAALRQADAAQLPGADLATNRDRRDGQEPRYFRDSY